MRRRTGYLQVRRRAAGAVSPRSQRALKPVTHAPCWQAPTSSGACESSTSVRIVRQWDEVSIEMAFAVTARDRYGRIDRSGSRGTRLDPEPHCPSSPPNELAQRRGGIAVPDDAERQYHRGDRFCTAETRAARPSHRRVLADCAGPRTSLAAATRSDGRSTPSRQSLTLTVLQLARTLKHEMNRLDDVYGAEIELRVLVSAAFIHSPLAEVEAESTTARHSLTATLDLGRGMARSLTWGGPRSADPRRLARPINAGSSAARSAADPRIALDLLPPATFADCSRWLLERNGAIYQPSCDGINGALRLPGTCARSRF